MLISEPLTKKSEHAQRTINVPACDKDKPEIEYAYVVPTSFNPSSF